MDITISKECHGMLLLSYLRGVLGISRAMLIKLKKVERGILLNGIHVNVRAILSAGDLLSLSVEDTEADENPYLEAVDIPLDILYEDDDVVAVNKPAGMVTHTTRGHYNDSLANAMYSIYKMQGRAFVFRAVNRLDRETSGVVLVSKNKMTAHKIAKALQNGELDKRYIAIVHGRLEGSGEITGHICRCGDSIITRRVCASDEVGAAFAHTRYKVLFPTDKYSVILASPITGRTHQLRVHFSSIGHPIVGDSLYGEASDEISRQALHAIALRFPSPRNGEEKKLYAPLFADMQALCRGIGMDEDILGRIEEVGFDTADTTE